MRAEDRKMMVLQMEKQKEEECAIFGRQSLLGIGLNLSQICEYYNVNCVHWVIVLNFVRLCQLILTIPPTTVESERRFTYMHLIKTKKRTKLVMNHLNLQYQLSAIARQRGPLTQCFWVPNG